MCRKGDTESDIKDLVEKFVGQLLAISEKSFNQMQEAYHDVIGSLNEVIDAKNAYNLSAGLKNSISDKKDLKKIIITWLKRFPCVGFNSANYGRLRKTFNSNFI